MKLDKTGRPSRLFAFLHAKKRAKERYSKNFSDTQYRRINTLVELGKVVKGVFISWKRRELWVWHNQELYRVIYDTDLKRIVTFLPKQKRVL